MKTIMQSNAVLCVSLSVLMSYFTEASRKDCRAPVTAEGEKAVMTFFVRPEISMSTAPLYLYVKRGDDTGAHVEIPLPGSNRAFSSEENTTVTLPFRLVFEDNCPAEASREHYVRLSGPNLDPGFCVLRLSEGTCAQVVNPANCPCGENGSAVFTKTLTHADSGVWTWTSGTGISEDLEVTFKIMNSTQAGLSKKPSNTDHGATAADEMPLKPSQDEASATVPAVNRITNGNKGTKHSDEDDKDPAAEGRHDDKDDDNDDKLNSEENGNVTDDKIREKENADADDKEHDGTLQGGAVIAVIFAVVNVVTIVIVAVVVILCRRRRRKKRRERRRPNARLPSLPSDSTTQSGSNDLKVAGNRYSALGRLSSRFYEEIPAAPAKTGRDSDGYEIQKPRGSEYGYEVVA